MPHVDEGLLHAYLDGELTPVERARVDEHLAGCLACRTRRDEERQLIEQASKLLGFALPADRPAPPLSALARPRPRRFWHVRMPLAWAATIVLAIGLGWKLSEQLAPAQNRTMEGPVAVRQDEPAQRQTRSAPPTVADRGILERRSTQTAPPPTQKSAQRRDTTAANQIAGNATGAAEEKSGAGVAAPAPAAVPQANLAPRMQAAELDEVRANLDSAAIRTILGRDPLVIPGLTVRSITRSPRAPNEVMIEQALDSTQVIVLYESRQTMTQAAAQRERVSARDIRAPATAKAAPDSPPGRLIGDVMVEIQARVSADSLQKLLGKIKP
jgi:hypothetical protein